MLPVIFFFSCVKEDVVWLKSVESKLVLNACLTPGQEITAYLGKTVGTGEKYDDLDLKNPGEISVYINEEFKGVMSYVEVYDSIIGLERKYILPNVKPGVGEEVKFRAEVQDYKPVTASTIIPDAPELLSVDTVRFLINSWDEERMRVYITMKDNPGKHDYYRIMMDLEIEGNEEEKSSYYSSSYPSYYDYYYGYGYRNYYVWLYYEDPVFTSDLSLQSVGTQTRDSYGIFTDNLFNGEEYILKFSFSSTPTYMGEAFSSDFKTSYNVKLLSLSDSYYNYYKQSGNLSFAIGNIQLVPSNEYLSPYSNVENGFGLVYAYNEMTHEIKMGNHEETN